MLCPSSNCFALQSNESHQQLAYFTAFDFNMTLRASAWVRGQLGAFISSLHMQYIRCSCMLAKWKRLITLKTSFFRQRTHQIQWKNQRAPKAKFALHPVCMRWQGHDLPLCHTHFTLHIMHNARQIQFWTHHNTQTQSIEEEEKWNSWEMRERGRAGCSAGLLLQLQMECRSSTWQMCAYVRPCVPPLPLSALICHHFFVVFSRCSQPREEVTLNFRLKFAQRQRQQQQQQERKQPEEQQGQQASNSNSSSSSGK